MNTSTDFPLGVPVNRTPPKTPEPIAGRPNWYRDNRGHEFYREPGQPMPASTPPKGNK